MTELKISETLIDTALGEVYVKTWSAAATDRARAPVILLHDSLGCVELWRDFPLRLATALERTVVAYDRIGFGRSAVQSGRTPPSFVQDEASSTFEAVIGHFALERFVVFGHSVGGGMAVEIAARFPSACEALVTEAAQAFVEEKTREGIRQARQEFARPGQIERLAKYHGTRASWVLNSWIDTWLSPAFANWSLDTAARRVTSPLLAIHGELDEYGSASQPVRIADQVRGPATVRILPGCGHVPHREAPDTVIGLVSALLAPGGS